MAGRKWKFIDNALKNRRESGQFRKLTPVIPGKEPGTVIKNGQELINFCSNDYLGLSAHPYVVERSVEFLHKYGAGSTASRLISGTYDIHEQLEEKLASLFKKEAVLLFNSGYQLNTSVIASLANRNSLILADRKVHNSILQGALLSNAELKRYDHNDHDHLRAMIEESGTTGYSRIIILSETVFSMDGDRNDLDKLGAIAEEYDAILYSDDAHALGVLGDRGLGLNYENDRVDLSIGTFGKSFGAFGAFASVSQSIKDYLINYCGGFIYTTSLPPSVIGALDAASDLIPAMEEERKQLQNNIRYFRNELNELGLSTVESDTQIIPVIIGMEKEALDLSVFLEENGFMITAIRPPTVERGSSRVRITLSASHTEAQVEALLASLKKWIRK
ncbi:aminotransferase class I/II-fold pyridoxal phosphate-dependent enzyme [Balneola sp. MJW-20]|uniref:aminotransferase class I/II-fold pyridoxal phosphate-dependent enzyme n=1 Tax=Gracilimonas aurantiaca TaxID=3234185 RepID=UPI003466CF00